MTSVSSIAASAMMLDLNRENTQFRIFLTHNCMHNFIIYNFITDIKINHYSLKENLKE